ncbi:hypothetical protein BsWGS_12859 [Bradybaena similaris]
MFLPMRILIMGLLVASSSAFMVLSNGTCQNVPGQEDFDWKLHRGRWYVVEAFDVPYLTRLTCMTIDYILPDNKTVHIATSGVRHYNWFGIPFWHTTVLIREKGIIANLSQSSELAASLGQNSLHLYNTRYVVVETDYDNYSLVYACYEPTIFDFKIEAAWILTRKFGEIPYNLEQLKNNLTIHNVDTNNFKPANNTNCCIWVVEH